MGDCDPALDDLSCCSDDSQCGLGEGDCDSDSHCAGDLTCGNDNCPSPAASYMDCCEGKLVLKFNSKDKMKIGQQNTQQKNNLQDFEAVPASKADAA